MINIDAWAQTINGKYLDLDNSPAYQPWQCHDVWLSYLYHLGGKPGDGYAPNGYTHSVWQHFPVTPNLTKLFIKLPPGKVKRGDVVFYNKFAGIGTHVTVALADQQGTTYKGIHQNPKHVHIDNKITTVGMIGILRPKTQTTNTLTEPTTQEKDENKMKNVAIYRINEKGLMHCAIFNPGSGFWIEYQGSGNNKTDTAYNNALAKAMETGDFILSHVTMFDTFRKACEQVRAAGNKN